MSDQEETDMGFMDKAKQMAEQAQQKIDETQKQFNDKQSARSPGGSEGGGARYDEHGRPIPADPAAQQPPTSAPASDPAVAEGVGVPQPPEAVEPQAATEPDTEPVPPPAPPKEGMNASPDPFKPLQ